jgi:hypothetical protein
LVAAARTSQAVSCPISSNSELFPSGLNDNAPPHWPDMKTFPHHLHLESEKKVSECREVFVEDVLNKIETIIRL